MTASRNALALFLLLGLILLAPAAARSEDGKWEYALVPYLWGAGLNGDLTVRGRTVNVDQSFSDILDNLEMAGMLHFEAKKGRWGVIADGDFVALGTTAEGNVAHVDVDLDMVIVEAEGFYEANKYFQVLFGGRYVDLSSDLDFKNLGQKESASKDWLDPVVGGRVIAPMGKEWEFVLRGDIGGFGVGSEFSWNATATFGWQATDHFALLFGYRYLDMDYEDGDGNDRFEYDMAMMGPFVGFGFEF